MSSQLRTLMGGTRLSLTLIGTLLTAAFVVGCGGKQTEPPISVSPPAPAASLENGSVEANSAAPASVTSRAVQAESVPAERSAAKQQNENSVSTGGDQSATTNRAAATVAEATRVIDLQTLPLVEGADRPSARSVARLTYLAPTDVETSFQFHRKQLQQWKWQELDGGYVTAQAASATFARDGFRLSLVVTPSSPPKSMVTILNLGNVDLIQIPVPADAVQQYAFPATVAYLTEATVNDAAETVRNLLLEGGWQPYGHAGNAFYFKQNANRLTANFVESPAQAGKTMIMFSSEQLSADLPVPPDAQQVQYSESPIQVGFDTSAAMDEVDQYLRRALGDHGWQATTERPVQQGIRHFVIFRNPQKELVETQFSAADGNTRVLVRYQTAAEVEEADQRAREAMQRIAERQNTPAPTVVLALPAEAKITAETAARLEFTLPTRKARSVAEGLQSQLQEAGWRASDSLLEPMLGNLTLEKEGQSISILYVETGVLPAEVTVTAIGTALQVKVMP